VNPHLLQRDSDGRGIYPDLIPWPKYREDLLSLNPGMPLSADPRLLITSEAVKNGQRYRRSYLSGLPRTCTEFDELTLRLAVRDLRRYRDKIAAELETLRNRAMPVEILQVFENEIEYTDDSVLYIEDALAQRKEAMLTSISRIVQKKISLAQERDELKKKTPSEYHKDIDRAFQRAIEQLGESEE